MHPRRTSLQVLVCIALLVTACSGSPRPAPPTAQAVAPTAEPVSAPTVTPAPPPDLPRFEEGPCSFDVPAGVQASCGYVVVPEDHANPAGPTIRLALVVFRSQSGERQPDPVIVLAGGPGEKIMDYAAMVQDQWQPMVGDRDLIIFDQRGAGQSEPALECPEMEQAFYDTLAEPDPAVSDRVIFDALHACRQRLQQEGRNLSAYNTAQNAADVEAIRVALGYDQVNLVGASYGSYLAQAVMRDFPGRIRSVAVTSVLPLEKSFFIDSIPAAPGAITRLLDACAADEGCNKAYPDLQNVLYQTIDRLNKKPVKLTLTHPLSGETYEAVLDGDGVVGNLVLLLYETQFLPTLPRAVYNVSQGDYQLMTQLLSINLLMFDAGSRGMEYSVLCAEDLIGRTPQEYLDSYQALPKPLRGRESPEDAAKYGPSALCQEWNVAQADASVKQPLSSEIPTLILEGEFDPVTPPAFGQLLADHLPNSHFFILPGLGHDVLVSNECARQVVGAFLDHPAEAPTVDCVAEMASVGFDIPGASELTFEPYTNDQGWFTGVVPQGWTELAPGTFVRGNSVADPTVIALAGGNTTKAALLAVLAAQLGVDPSMKPVRRAKVGALTWDLYEFEAKGFPFDLALAAQGKAVYMVMMTSSPDERAALYEQLYKPVLQAMTPSGG